MHAVSLPIGHLVSSTCSGEGPSVDSPEYKRISGRSDCIACISSGEGDGERSPVICQRDEPAYSRVCLFQVGESSDGPRQNSYLLAAEARNRNPGATISGAPQVTFHGHVAGTRLEDCPNVLDLIPATVDPSSRIASCVVATLIRGCDAARLLRLHAGVLGSRGPADSEGGQRDRSQLDHDHPPSITLSPARVVVVSGPRVLS